MPDSTFNTPDFIAQLELPPGVVEQSPTLVIVMYFLFKMLPIIVSGISIFLGYRLFILGVTGKASLSVNTKTLKGQLINAAPGLFFAVGGMVALIIIVIKGIDITLVQQPVTHQQLNTSYYMSASELHRQFVYRL